MMMVLIIRSLTIIIAKVMVTTMMTMMQVTVKMTLIQKVL